jgi:glycerol kinase
MKHPPHILAIDQGTTNTKAILVAADGAVVAHAARPLAVSYPQSAWVEQDPLAQWESVRDAVDACLAGAGVAPAAVAIANQRESIVLWERATGRPVGPCVVWQCTRGASFCAELRSHGLEPWLRQRTGLTIDPMFSASKARWLLAQAPDGFDRAHRGELCLGTVDSWLLWNLTGGAVHACDLTNASRTQLLDLRIGAWDPGLLELFGVPLAALPEVRPSGALHGTTVAMGRLPAGLPIAALIGDSHAALFGHAGFSPGVVKATYGTGSSLMTPTDAPIISARGLSTTVAWARAGRPVRYALEGNIYATGAAVQWVGELLGAADPAAHVAALAAQVPDAGGVHFIPAFTGLGAPHWNDAARGLLTGVTRGTSAAHLARAALEAIAFQVRDVFDVMVTEAGAAPQALLADGGASRNDLLMQFQADVLGAPVMRTASADLSALGAAYLAGLTLGIWPSEAAIAALPRPADRFEPHLSSGERAARYEGWQQAVRRACLPV